MTTGTPMSVVSSWRPTRRPIPTRRCSICLQASLAWSSIAAVGEGALRLQLGERIRIAFNEFEEAMQYRLRDCAAGGEAIGGHLKSVVEPIWSETMIHADQAPGHPRGHASD